MKKYYTIILLLLASTVIAPSCTDYLDKAPEAGLTEEEVFEKYSNFTAFFYRVYNMQIKNGNNWRDVNIKLAHPRYIDYIDQKLCFDGLTDAADLGRRMIAQPMKQGTFGAEINKFTYDLDRRPILEAMFRIIRICNISLANVDRINDASDPIEVEDLRGQAYFIRGYAYFALCRLWGGMPYLTQALGAEDNWDLPRLSRNATYRMVAADCDSAFTAFSKAGRIRRDVRSGTASTITPDARQAYPCGISALALKSRALLYAASPLNNEKGQQDWIDAAKAAQVCLETALAHNFSLLSWSDWNMNCYGTAYTNEQLWAWYCGTKNYNNGDYQGYVAACMGNSTTSWSSTCPTQNLIDRYENTAGDILTTERDRDKAEAEGRYHPHNPYYMKGTQTAPQIPSNNELRLDPRFYETYWFNERPMVWGTLYHNWSIKGMCNMWQEDMGGGNIRYSDHVSRSYLGVSLTGYYVRRINGDQTYRNQIANLPITEPTFRLAEIYLNYAEAVNEAYGPNGSAPGSSLTAVAALNTIRQRAMMPDVKSEFTSNAEAFRPRIKNERVVELMFESDHYYFDTNRWKDAKTLRNQELIGLIPTKLPAGYDQKKYPRGYRYDRVPLPVDRQIMFDDKMYFWPFNSDDYFKFKNFDTSLNPVW